MKKSPSEYPKVFLDIETDHLNPRIRRPWDIALIRREVDGTERTHQFFVNLGDLRNSDPIALSIGGYWDRHPDVVYPDGINRNVLPPSRAAHQVRTITHGAILVGAIPSFDAETLAKMLYNNGLVPTWNHRLVCVESVTAGRVGRLVGGLTDCAAELGLEVDKSQTHTALYDAQLAMRVYDHIMATEELIDAQP